MIECGWDLKGPMPPLNTYSQTIPKYSWSAASLNAAGYCEGCTFYAYDKVPALRWRGRTEHRKELTAKQGLPMGSRVQRQKYSAKASWKWVWRIWAGEGCPVGTQIGVRIACVASVGHVNLGSASPSQHRITTTTRGMHRSRNWNLGSSHWMWATGLRTVPELLQTDWKV